MRTHTMAAKAAAGRFDHNPAILQRPWRSTGNAGMVKASGKTESALSGVTINGISAASWLGYSC